VIPRKKIRNRKDRKDPQQLELALAPVVKDWTGDQCRDAALMYEGMAEYFFSLAEVRDQPLAIVSSQMAAPDQITLLDLPDRWRESN
jgi:hypothetical protein